MSELNKFELVNKFSNDEDKFSYKLILDQCDIDLKYIEDIRNTIEDNINVANEIVNKAQANKDMFDKGFKEGERQQKVFIRGGWYSGHGYTKDVFWKQGFFEAGGEKFW